MKNRDSNATDPTTGILSRKAHHIEASLKAGRNLYIRKRTKSQDVTVTVTDQHATQLQAMKGHAHQNYSMKCKIKRELIHDEPNVSGVCSVSACALQMTNT